MGLFSLKVCRLPSHALRFSGVEGGVFGFSGFLRLSQRACAVQWFLCWPSGDPGSDPHSETDYQVEANSANKVKIHLITVLRFPKNSARVSSAGFFGGTCNI